MPIYVNVGYPPAPDGKEWKHDNDDGRRCRVSLEREAAGYPVSELKNMDTGKTAYSDHKRRRWPVCMPDSKWPDSEPHNPSLGSGAGRLTKSKPTTRSIRPALPSSSACRSRDRRASASATDEPRKRCLSVRGASPLARRNVGIAASRWMVSNASRSSKGGCGGVFRRDDSDPRLWRVVLSSWAGSRDCVARLAVRSAERYCRPAVAANRSWLISLGFSDLGPLRSASRLLIVSSSSRDRS